LDNDLPASYKRGQTFVCECGIYFPDSADSLPINEDETMSYISEFLLMSQSGQNYIKDIKFSAFPFGDYNITVIFYR
jgi:hypothetical protein